MSVAGIFRQGLAGGAAALNHEEWFMLPKIRHAPEQAVGGKRFIILYTDIAFHSMLILSCHSTMQTLGDKLRQRQF
jgi:hypothetical protein